ncbi:MAG: putative methyl-accepting chemotaxis protein [Tardiphaga sp.]|nr:putative methyl-accepting chemotaxis protein [Tardiphaga sp.]
MSFLARFKIITKFLAVILLMASIAGTVAFLGISSMKAMNDQATEMLGASNRSLMAARLNRNVVSLNRAEFELALDPRPENRDAVLRSVEKELKEYEERYAGVSQTKDERARALMPEIKAQFGVYRASMDKLFKLASAVKDSKMTEETERLRDAAHESRQLAEALLAKIRVSANLINERTDRLAKESSELYQSASQTMMLISVVGVLLGLVLGFLIGQYGIVKPIQSIVALLKSLAAGNFDQEIKGTERKDEVGDIAKTALVFKENGLEKIRMEAEQKELETFTAAQRKRDMIKLADDFENAVGEIINTVSSASTELEASATSLTTTAERSQKIAIVVAAASEEASANVQSVAAATEEMSSTVNEIGRQVQESARIASEAVEQARATNARVGELSEAAARIGDVVELITIIAGQTNLLALNATIEAARAGDAGRGFAVVASEVKALAEQTAKATGEISQQIAGIQNATGFSVTAIKEIGNTIGKMSEIAAAIAAAVEEQGTATQEIARNVQQAAQGTQEVSSNIVDVQRGTSETGSASSQVLSAAQLLSQDSNKLKLEVGRFLSTVRAA